jgi:hypothetical protein
MVFSVDVKNKAARWGANASLTRLNTFDIELIKVSHDTPFIQSSLASPRKPRMKQAALSLGRHHF